MPMTFQNCLESYRLEVLPRLHCHSSYLVLYHLLHIPGNKGPDYRGDLARLRSRQMGQQKGSSGGNQRRYADR